MRRKVVLESGLGVGWWDRSFQPLGLEWWSNGKRKLFWRRAWQGLGLGGARLGVGVGQGGAHRL